jgi:hypothetical protein
MALSVATMAVPVMAGRMIAMTRYGAVFEVDVNDGTATQVGQLDWGDNHAGYTLTYDGGRDALYLTGQEPGVIRTLYTIDPKTWTVVDQVNIGQGAFAIEYDPSTGTIYHANTLHNPIFSTLNPETGALTWWGFNEISTDTDCESFAYMPDLDTLFMFTSGGLIAGNQQAFYRVNRQTGLAIRISWEYTYRWMSDMAYDPETKGLYAISLGGKFCQIEPRNGEVTLLGEFGLPPSGEYWGGLVHLPDDAGVRACKRDTARSKTSEDTATKAESLNSRVSRKTSASSEAEGRAPDSSANPHLSLEAASARESRGKE